VAAALYPQVALAHAQLVQPDPAPNAILQAVPAAVTLVFTEPVTPAGAGIHVYSPTGRQVAAPAKARGSVLTATIVSSEQGTYVVSWQVLAADTHPSRGEFAFSVGRPGPNPYSALLSTGEIGTTTPSGLVLQALARWMHFMGFALVFGVTAYQAWTRRPERAWLLVGTGIVLLIAAEPLFLLAQLASLSLDGDTAIAVLGSGFGRLLGLRLGVSALAWVVSSMPSRWPVIGLGIVMAGLDAASAHAIPGLAAGGFALTAVHVGAMGLWAGGVAAFVARPDARFPRYALGTFGVAAGSGLLLALAHIGALPALYSTEYGLVLGLKVLAVGGVLALAALRRHRLELGLLLAVVAAAAVLGALPPPR
jgi:copper transport protein